MKAFHRLHALRQANDAAGYAMQELRPRFDRIAGRHENGTAPRAVSAYQLFQTPTEIAAQMVARLNLKPGARVLEPSAGLGRLLDALTPFDPAEVVAVESSPDCAGELFRQERQGVRILQRDFLTVFPEEIGYFDAVVMNPPFHMRADIGHIEHARTFLQNDGQLVALCMDTAHRETRLQPDSLSWTKLAEGTFRKEGTDVATVILTMGAFDR